MSTSPPSPAPAVIDRRQTVQVGLASGLSAAVGMLAIVASARVLGPEGSAQFQAFWAALFACFGLLSGLSIETTRSTASARTSEGRDDPRGPRVALVVAVVSIGAVVVLTASAVAWAPAVFPEQTVQFGALLIAGVAFFTGHTTLVGALAGRSAWGAYSGAIALESATRAVLVGVAVAIGAGLMGMAAGAAVAAVIWFGVWAVSRQAREAMRSRTDVDARTFARRAGAALLGQGASAILVVGFPVLLRLSTDDETFLTAAPLMLALTLTRAPLLIPLNAYQGVAVTHFVAHRDRGLRAAVRPLAAVAALGTVGTGLALVIGSPLLELVGGPGFTLSGTVMAGLVAAATLIALITLTGALNQALERHPWYLAGWVVAATVATTTVFLLPGTMATRTITALVAGPAVGIAIHLLGVTRGASATAAPGEERTLPLG